jgi:Fe-S cluster biogenesis protein NfuA
MESEVKAILDKVRPYIQMHGGDVHLAGIKDGVVKLSVSGACVGCALAELTYNQMLGEILRKEVAGVKDVVVEV